MHQGNRMSQVKRLAHLATGSYLDRLLGRDVVGVRDVPQVREGIPPSEAHIATSIVPLSHLSPILATLTGK